MRKIIVIPTRYASTRLPGKPLREIAGKPLIRHVFERACESRLADEIVIATDDQRIEDAALSFGAVVAMTSPLCESGTDRVYEAVKGKDADIVVNLQGDEPFMDASLIDGLFSVIEEERLYMATVCSPVVNEGEYLDTNTVKVVLDRDSHALYFSRSPIPYLSNPKSQISNLKSIYKHIGIYGFSMKFLSQFVSMDKGVLEKTESLEQLRVLENGYRIRVLIADYDGFGIDTEGDLKRAENLFRRLSRKAKK